MLNGGVVGDELHCARRPCGLCFAVTIGLRQYAGRHAIWPLLKSGI